MDEKKFGMLDEKQQKKYLFKENVRLNELKQELEADRELIDIQKGMLHSQQRKNELMKKQLESQSVLFDQKWEILERETRQLTLDKEKFNREKLCIVTRYTAKPEEVCPMLKMSRYFSGVSMIQSQSRKDTGLC